jgi:hypothetical protein
MAVNLINLTNMANYNTAFEITYSANYTVNGCVVSGGNNTPIENNGFYQIVYTATSTNVVRFCYFETTDELVCDIVTTNPYYVLDNRFLKDNKNNTNFFVIYANRPMVADINGQKVVLWDENFYRQYPDYKNHKIVANKNLIIYDENNNILYERALTI